MEIEDRIMRRIHLVLLALLVTGTSPARAEVPPYTRTLQGDDAKKAAALQERIEDLWTAAQFGEAVKPAEELRQLRQGAQGKDHWEAANAARLVETLRQAAALHAGKRRALAEVPALTAKSEECHARGRYAEAERLYRRALAAWEEALGPQHASTATARVNLALALNAQERYREAERLCRQGMAVQEAVLGPHHPLTAQGYNNLASSLEAQGAPGRPSRCFARPWPFARKCSAPSTPAPPPAGTTWPPTSTPRGGPGRPSRCFAKP
jgi:tetratricopeptide (TPR) repeat protein